MNDEIAEESKNTVLQAFNKELSSQLSNAQSIIDMLNIIEEKRKELANDGTQLDNEKKSVLDDAEDDIVEKQKERTSELLQEYASYTDKRLQMEKQYVNDMLLLQKKLDVATTPEEKKAISGAMENRRAKYKQDSKSSGDEDYDNMIAAFKSFEQKRIQISDEYDEKRRIARLHNNEELVKQLNIEEAKAQLQNSFDELKASPEYVSAFEDLKNVSTETIQSLLKRFDEVKESAAENLQPEDLKTFTDTMMKMSDELNSRNPFEAKNRI